MNRYHIKSITIPTALLAKVKPQKCSKSYNTVEKMTYANRVFRNITFQYFRIPSNISEREKITLCFLFRKEQMVIYVVKFVSLNRLNLKSGLTTYWHIECWLKDTMGQFKNFEALTGYLYNKICLADLNLEVYKITPTSRDHSFYQLTKCTVNIWRNVNLTKYKIELSTAEISIFGPIKTQVK